MDTTPTHPTKRASAFVNGRVYTVDESRPWCSAFIVSESGIFSAIGTDEEIRSQAQQEGLVVNDLEQQFVMPGIHDAHTHLLAAPLHVTSEVALGEANHLTIGEKLKDNVCACSFPHTRGDWLIGHAYSFDQFPGQLPDRKYLDTVFPEQPVIVKSPLSYHHILLNTAGLKRAGYDLAEKDNPPAGMYVRREDGEMTGELVERAATQAILSLPPLALSDVKRVLQYGMRTSAQYGVTSCQEASASTLYLQALRELEHEGLITMDLYTHIVHSPANFAMEHEDSLHALLDAAETYESKHVRTNFVKFFVDGSPAPPHFTQSDLDASGVPDESKMMLTWDAFYAAVKKYDAKGMTCKIHVAGEGSARRALDILATVRKDNPSGPKHEVAHCNAVHGDDVPRFAELGITAELSPAIFHSDYAKFIPHLFRWPFEELLSSGARMTIGSDWCVTDTPNMFPALAFIVERIGAARAIPGTTKSAKNRGGETLCRLITLSGAEAVGNDHQSGSITIGKKANFIVVDRDLSLGDFDGASVLKTWFEGNLVWDKMAEAKSSQG